MTIQMSSLNPANPAVRFGAKRSSWGEDEQNRDRQDLQNRLNASSHGQARPGVFSSSPGAFGVQNQHGNAPYLSHAGGGSPLPSGRERNQPDQYQSDTNSTGNAGNDPHFRSPVQTYDVDGDVQKGESKAYDLCSAPGIQLNGLFKRRGARTWITEVGLVTGDKKLLHDFKSAPQIIEQDGQSTRMKRDVLYELAPGVVAQWKGGHLRIQSQALRMDLQALLGNTPLAHMSMKSTFTVIDRDVAVHGLMGQTLTGKTAERRGNIYGPAAYLNGTGKQGEGVLETMSDMQIINGNLVGGLIGGEVRLSKDGDRAVDHYETLLLEACDPFSQFYGESITGSRYMPAVAEENRHLFALV